MLKQTLAEAVYFSRNRTTDILKIVWPLLALPVFIGIPVSHLSTPDSRELYMLYTVVLWLSQPYFRCRLIKYLNAVSGGQPYNQKVTFTQWSRLLLVYLVCGIAAAIGLMALVLPGLYLALRFGFVEFEVVRNERTSMQSISESWKSTKNDFWLLAQGSVCIMIVPIALTALISYSAVGSMASSMLTEMLSEVMFFSALMVLIVFYYRVFQLNQERS